MKAESSALRLGTSVFLEAPWPMPDRDCPEHVWRELHRFVFNEYRPQTLVRRIEAEIAGWLPYPVVWSGGLLLARSPYGGYVWHFAVQLEQHRRWQTSAFVAGRSFGRDGAPDGPGVPSAKRDANPYPRLLFEHHAAWDTGYILGISEHFAARAGSWEAYQRAR